MRRAGVRDAMRQVREDARGFGKGVAKGLHRGGRHRHSDGADGALGLGASLEERRDMYGFTVRPQHLEKYLEYDKIYKEEEVHRSGRWEQFLDAYSNAANDWDGKGGGDEGGVEERESCWGSLRAVEQAVQRSGAGNGGGIGACPWAEELKKLVWEGVPVSLRGELWQIFTGAKERSKDGYYQEKLEEVAKPVAEPVEKAPRLEKWASQIEKDLPRTFPGHPILGEDGLGSLRRMLTAYARHNPKVGYCQAMNFLAALLLLFMQEEDAFWTLASIVDVYFEGYYTEKMTEAQVDQLVFTELVREQLPKLAKHLETVDVEISWFSGAWFLSIFVNVLPWECVLRVWDVLLYEGNRSMLFRTALALLEMHASSLLQLHDNGDVLSMLQSMGETTFDSSQLVLSACLGFQAIDEERLQELRTGHRPTVIAEMHKRSLDVRQWRTTNAAAKQAIINATNGSNFPVAPLSIDRDEESTLEPQFSVQKRLSNVEDEDSSTLEPQFSVPKCLTDESNLEPHHNGLNGVNIAEVGERGTLKYQLSAPKFFSYEPLVSHQNPFKREPYGRIDETDEFEDTESSDLQVEVSRLRKELDDAIQAREEAEFRVEGLKLALTEMDQSRHSPVEMEKLKEQVAHLKQALADKREQEAVTVEVLVRLEQENRKADDARRRAVEEAEENRQTSARALVRAANELEVMKERASAAEIMVEAMQKRAVMAESMLEAIGQQAAEELRAMEKRAVMAESMLEATLDFHSGSGPRTKRGVEPKLEPKLKGDEAKDNPRFRNHAIPQQNDDAALEERQNASKLEEAEKFTNFASNKTSKLGRPFPLRDKNKVHAEHNEDDRDNQEVGDSTSVSLNSSPALIRNTGNIQYNSGPPEIVKLQYIKRRL